MDETCINGLFDPQNMGIGTTFRAIGPKLVKLWPFSGHFGLSCEDGGRGIGLVGYQIFELGENLWMKHA